ncbi:MAG TPA: hypothetical protein VF815_45520 [Myxococcaceae bacterium]
MRGGAVVLALVASGLALPASASPTPVPGAYYGAWEDEKDREEDAEPREFVFINYFFARGTVGNQVGDPSGLKGVSLGPIGNATGSAVLVDDLTAYYVEQRWIPVIEYSPWFVDGLATFRAQLEVDFLWGRAANSVQPNEGGGFNADMINIQTKNINVAFYPFRDPAKLTLLLGTQSVYDTYFDPTRTPLNDIIRTGYKLAFLGSDATGLSIFSSYKGHAKLSLLPLGSAQADRATGNDPRLKYIWLATGDYVYPVRPGTNVGVSAWMLRDDSKGEAFAFEGLVRSGPASVGLGSFTGTGRFELDRPTGTVFWLGTHFNHNIDLRTGPFGASGFLMYNGGSFQNGNPESTLNPEVTISGLSANLELLYNWGRTPNDVVTLEAMYTTGDEDLSDGKYKGAFTMNMYGLPGAVWFNHKTLILFPFTSAANNYTGAVADISNQGYGVRAAIATGAMDLIANKLNLKLGAALATSDVTPPRWDENVPRGRFIGTEVNAELKYTIRYLMTLGLHTGYMFKGDFYDGAPRVTKNPFAAFTTFTWYAF